MEINSLSKMIQLSIVFHNISKGFPMKNYPHYINYLSFHKVLSFPSSYWSITSGWISTTYLAQVENDDIKKRFQMLSFLSISLNELRAIDDS